MEIVRPVPLEVFIPHAEQDLHVALAGVPVRADALALRPVRIEDAWHGTHRPLRHADLVGVGLQHPAAEGRMALLRSRHLVDVAGRHSVAFLRTLLKDKLRKLVGHCLVPLKSAHERQRHESLAAVLALHARDPRQIDDAKTRANLARHASVEDEVGMRAGAAAFLRQWLPEHDLQPEVLVDEKNYGLQQLGKRLLVRKLLHSIDELVQAETIFR